MIMLLDVAPGAPLKAFGDVPAGLIGAHWADVRTWGVLFWEGGIAFAAQLKSETAEPPDLESIRDHKSRHPEVFQRIQPNAGLPA